MTKQEIGEKIKYFREKNNLKKNQLATLSGVSPTYINDLEAGRKCPSVEIISYICDALNITLVDFFAENIETKEISVESLSYNQKKLLNDFFKSLK